MAAPDRPATDRSLDAGRHPAETLTFLGVRPGMRVADLGAGPGYTTELLARAVGPRGTVYMQNEPIWLPFLTDALRERFSHTVMASPGVIRADLPFEDPLPAEARGGVRPNATGTPRANTAHDRRERRPPDDSKASPRTQASAQTRLRAEGPGPTPRRDRQSAARRQDPVTLRGMVLTVSSGTIVSTGSCLVGSDDFSDGGDDERCPLGPLCGTALSIDQNGQLVGQWTRDDPDGSHGVVSLAIACAHEAGS